MESKTKGTMILRCGGLYATVAYSYDEEGNQIPRLSLDKKAKILAHNIYGVDLDPQAVEVTMISLYIKILEGEAPVGMVTERDIGRRIVAKKMPYDIKVSEIMTKKLVTVEPDVSLKDAARLMSTNKIRRLPVVKQNKLFGIVVASDFVRNLGKKTVTEEILDAMGRYPAGTLSLNGMVL